MIEAKQKEELSIGYLNIVCAYAGIAMSPEKHDESGVDYRLSKELKVRSVKYRATIEVQLKSTSQSLLFDDESFRFPFKAKNYNDFIKQSTCDTLLCVLVLPAVKSEWLSITPDELVLKKCMYWKKIEGNRPTENTQTVTLTIPKKNIVTSSALMELLTETAKRRLYDST
jgi:hypothetical protein